MMKDGSISFIRRPWIEQHSVLKKLGFRMPVKYGRYSLDIPSRVESTTDLISKFYIDSDTQAFSFTLPVNPSDISVSKFIESHQKYKSVSFDALPMARWLPMWKYPRIDIVHHKSRGAVFLSNMLITNNVGLEDFSDWTEGKVILFNQLKAKLEQEYSNEYERLSAEKALRYALTSVNQEVTLEKPEFRVRRLLYEFLIGRGTKTITIKFRYASSHRTYELTLSHNDYIDLFASLSTIDYKLDKIIFSLERAVHFGNRDNARQLYVKGNLLFNQDPISEILDFFWDLTDTPEGRRTILIYPQTIYDDGYGTGYSSYYPEKNEALNEWISKSAIVLEPGKTNIKRAALIIASLLIEGNLLVVRTPGMPLDKHIIALDINGVVDPYKVIGSSLNSDEWSGPPTDGMKWFNFLEWVKLRRAWIEIITKYPILSIYYLRNPQKFYDICKTISFINDHKINKDLDIYS